MDTPFSVKPVHSSMATARAAEVATQLAALVSVTTKVQVPGLPHKTLTALLPWPETILPPVTAHVYELPVVSDVV